jgi:hypothetical protein
MNASAEGAHMTHLRPKGVLVSTVLILISATSAYAIDKGHGPDGRGHEAVQAFVRGDIVLADREFDAEYRAHPNNPVAQFNMADLLRRHGQIAQADILYHQAAASGRNYIPDHLLEPHDATTTIRDVACRYLAEDGQPDPNCPTQRAEVTVVVPVIER